MAALTTGRRTPMQGNPVSALSLPVASGATIFKGSIVCVNSAGFATKGITATTLKAMGVLVDQNEGISTESVVNSGADGAISCRVVRGIFLFNNSATDAVDQNDIGSLCYIEDDNTVAETNGTSTRSAAGRVIALEPATGPSGAGVWVEIGNVATP